MKLNGYPYQWKIWYDNGSTFDSEQGAWADAPAWGVVYIAYLRPDTDDPKLGGRGWSVAQGESFFRITHDGEVVACNIDALMDYAANVLKVVKVGRMISAAEFRTISSLAHAELAYFDKQGFDKIERIE